MRFSIKLILPKPEIPIYYRTAFVSYIKKLLEGTPYFDLYYGRKFPKPFTFAVYLPIETIKGETIYLKPNGEGGYSITWNLSFAEPKLAMEVIRGLILTKEHNWRNEIKMEIKEIAPLKENFPEGSTKVVFKTLSPIFIKSLNGKSLEPSHPEFEKEFNEVHERIFKALGLHYSPVKVKVKTCQGTKFPCQKKRVVKLKLSKFEKETGKQLLHITAYDAILELQGESEVLKNLYRKGLGQRTAEGFGMVEVYPS